MVLNTEIDRSTEGREERRRGEKGGREEARQRDGREQQGTAEEGGGEHADTTTLR